LTFASSNRPSSSVIAVVFVPMMVTVAPASGASRCFDAAYDRSRRRWRRLGRSGLFGRLVFGRLVFGRLVGRWIRGLCARR
jgi:hypothetical protein